jgi:hypothetical protein
MAESTDERIKRFLAKQAAEIAEADRAKELAQERVASTRQAQQKWAADADIIRTILQEFMRKMAQLSPELQFEDIGVQGGSTATGHITGKLADKLVDATIRVVPDGTISASTAGPQFAHVRVQFGSPRQLSVFSATKAQYEQLLLDLLGAD